MDGFSPLILCAAHILNFCWRQQAEKGIATTGQKLKSELKEKEMKRKRLKSKVQVAKNHKKHKQQKKDKHRDISGGSTVEQKRRLDGFEVRPVDGNQRSLTTEGSGRSKCWSNLR